MSDMKPTKKNTTAPDVDMELLQSQERYQSFIHSSSEGIWRVELEKPISIKLSAKKQVELMFKYAYLAEANKAFAAMYNLESPDEITGSRLGELIMQDDPANTEYLMNFVKSGYKLAGAESREKTADGSGRIFLNSLVGQVQDGHIVRAWGTQADITEQHIAIESLKLSEERLALALASSRMGLWEWDATTNELTWSKELRSLFGVGLDETVTYNRYFELIHPEDRSNMKTAIEKAMKDGKQFAVEHRIILPDKSVRWVLCHGQAHMRRSEVISMIGTTMDINRRKMAELEARESEARFRNMADAAPVLIWVAGLQKELTYFNKPWRDFTGRDFEEDLGEGWKQVIHPDDLDYCVFVYHSAFDNREPYRMEYRLRRYDGKYLWMLDKGAPRYSTSGDFLGFVGSMIEVEEIKSTKKRQQELEEVNRKLKQQSEQLIELSNTKDEFISVASHQLRTPATGVKQYIGMLLEGYGGELNEGQIKMLHTAYESNERELRIIDDLLKVAHIDAGKVILVRENINLVDLINDVMSEQSDTFKSRKQSISFAHNSKQVIAHIDAERMRMVLENLIDNASKYTPEGKDIKIELTNTSKSLTISISDQGVGIAKKDIHRLFQKFSRVDNALSTLVGGTGLGLYWVKKIVTLHDGTISVESKLHKGTTFTITIPRDLP